MKKIWKALSPISLVLLGAGIVSCSSEIVKTGDRTYSISCTEDISHCYDFARQACVGPFQIRKESRGTRDEIEIYIQCDN